MCTIWVWWTSRSCRLSAGWSGEEFMGEENRTNNKQYEYPCLIQGKDGRLHLAFAYKNRIGIKYMAFTEEDMLEEKRESLYTIC